MCKEIILNFIGTPTGGLSNPNILDPIVTQKIPGRYTYKLTAEGISTTNLIKNGDFESGNSSFSSSYTFTPVNTTEGEYIVIPNPSSWNGGFTNCGDHTTGSGNMLVKWTSSSRYEFLVPDHSYRNWKNLSIVISGVSPWLHLTLHK